MLLKHWWNNKTGINIVIESIVSLVKLRLLKISDTGGLTYPSHWHFLKWTKMYLFSQEAKALNFLWCVFELEVL